MGAIEVCHESSAAWLGERTNGIGGSDAPQILGISPFGGPAKVAAVKLGYHVEDVESELHKWGHYSEAPLISAFQDETGIESRLSGFLWRSDNPKTPWLQATIDGECVDGGEPGGIQCKTALFSASAWDEGVPEYIQCQVQHEMAVRDWAFVYVLVLLRGYQFRWAKVERDEDFIDGTLLPSLGEFWRKLQANEPISPVGAPDHEWEALKALFPTPVSGKVFDLVGIDWMTRVDEWELAKERARDADKRAKALRNEIVAAIGDAEFATLDDGRRLSLKLTERAEYVAKATSFRTLRLVGKR